MNCCNVARFPGPLGQVNPTPGRVGTTIYTALSKKICFHGVPKASNHGGSVVGDLVDPTSVSSSPAPLSVQRPPPMAWQEIILFQAFGWASSKQGGTWYDTVHDSVKSLQQAHVSHVWLPPPSRSVSKEGYLPTQLYDLSSAYGDEKSLKDLNTALLQSGIRPVADIVINHRCADAQDEHGIWNTFRDDVPHPGHRIDWGPWAITGEDPEFHGTGNSDSGEDYGPSPDLDHSNPDVQAGIVDWLCWLREYIGFEGWRLDFAKGFSPEYAQLYIEKSLHFDGEGRKDFCVGEWWADAAWNGPHLEYNQDSMRQQLCDWCSSVGERSAVFDFTTKAQLQEAIKSCQYDRLQDSQGHPPGVIGWWPLMAVTFIDNHDTGSTQQHWPFPGGPAILQGYAYIMTHPGIPCIFWEHYVDSDFGGKIAELAALRRRAGVKADSPIQILAAEPDMYVACIASRLTCKLGPRHHMGDLLPQSNDGWTLALSGENWAIWER